MRVRPGVSPSHVVDYPWIDDQRGFVQEFRFRPEFLLKVFLRVMVVGGAYRSEEFPTEIQRLFKLVFGTLDSQIGPALYDCVDAFSAPVPHSAWAEHLTWSEKVQGSIEVVLTDVRKDVLLLCLDLFVCAQDDDVEPGMWN